MSNWHSVTAEGNIGSTDANQFFGLHSGNEITEGSILTGPISGTYGYQVGLTGTQVDQPFTMVGSSLTRVALPVGVLNGFGEDIVVSLYADSGGNPTGAALASCEVPKEHVSGIAAVAPIPVSLEGWASIDQVTPAFPYNSIYAAGMCTDGISAVMVGGYDVGAAYSNVVQTAVMDSTTLEPWKQRGQFPISAAAVAVACGQGYVIAAGGETSGPTLQSSVYTAQLNPDGSLGNWALQPALPVATGWGGLVYNNGYVYYIGGHQGAKNGSGGGSVSANIYYATLNSSGTVGPWNALAPLPAARWNFSPVIVNGWLIVVGGDNAPDFPPNTGQTNTVFAAKFNADGTLGAWQTWASSPLPTASEGNSTFSVLNNIVVVGGGTDDHLLTAYSLAISASGPDRNGWITQPSLPNPGGSTGALGDSCYSCSHFVTPGNCLVIPGFFRLFWGVPIIGDVSQVNSNQMISVPLPASGLTNGSKYHIVIAGDTSNPGVAGINDSYVQVSISASGAGNFPAQEKIGSGAWTSLGAGNQVPLTIYNGVSGLPLHFIEDTTGNGTPTKIVTVIWDAASRPIGIGDYCGAARSWMALTYDASGLLTGAA